VANGTCLTSKSSVGGAGPPTEDLKVKQVPFATYMHRAGSLCNKIKDGRSTKYTKTYIVQVSFNSEYSHTLRQTEAKSCSILS
jgi:hypothetical protein